MSFEHCTDPDGAPYFPQYGLAPHLHTHDGVVFSLENAAGFTPEDEDPTHGTWWCPHCGDGRPSLSAPSLP